jgi:RND family efflux transporter MFP subunit
MKQLLPYLTAAVLLSACGTSTPADELGRKRAERDSLKSVYDDIGKRIKEIEDWLTENDTSVRRNLPMVKTMVMAAGRFDHYVDVHGSVKADRAAALYALGGGRVRSIHVGAGDHVRQGDLLISLDNDVLRDQIQQARTAYDLAKTTFEKQEQLWKQRIGSEMQYLQSKAQMEQAEAALNALEEQQRLSNVTAPFDGTVDEVMARVGDMAAPGVPMARVVDLSGAQLEADMPEPYLGRVKKDATALVRFPSLNDSVLTAHVEHVGTFIDPANRTFKVVLHVPGGGAYIRPNLLSDISVLDHSIDSALVVPSSAILEDVNGTSYIFLLTPTHDDEARATKRMVRRVSEYKGITCIEPLEAGGLREGVAVVTEGARNVSEGQTVRIAKL